MKKKSLYFTYNKQQLKNNIKKQKVKFLTLCLIHVQAGKMEKRSKILRRSDKILYRSNFSKQLIHLQYCNYCQCANKSTKFPNFNPI